MADEYDDLGAGELRDLLRQRDKRLREERESNETTTAWAEAVAENNKALGELIEAWREVFRMQQDPETGSWIFDPGQTELWQEHDALIVEHNKLVKDWNRFVPRYNAMVQDAAPRAPGRPLHASEKQTAAVLKMRADGGSLRDIAAATSLTFRTVRSIVARPEREAERDRLLRRAVFNKEAAVRYRARKRERDRVEKGINTEGRQVETNMREARRLGILRSGS